MPISVSRSLPPVVLPDIRRHIDRVLPALTVPHHMDADPKAVASAAIGRGDVVVGLDRDQHYGVEQLAAPA
jgi:hypothetical protein